MLLLRGFLLVALETTLITFLPPIWGRRPGFALIELLSKLLLEIRPVETMDTVFPLMVVIRMN